MQLTELELVSTIITDSFCSALTCDKHELRSRFVLTGTLIPPHSHKPMGPYLLRSILLDTGALGANFINEHVVNELSQCLTVTPITSGRSVRLGNQSVVTVNTETDIQLSVTDYNGIAHTHHITCVVLPHLSRDVIIGLFDLFGSFYNLFSSAISSARTLMSSCKNHLSDAPLLHAVNHTPFLGSISPHTTTTHTTTTTTPLVTTSPTMFPDDIFLCGACIQDISTHLQCHKSTTYDFRPNTTDTSSCYLCSIRDVVMSRPPTTLQDGDVVYPWSQPLDDIAPEESETPDPFFFNDDLLNYLSTPLEEARAIYDADLATHVTPEIAAAVPRVLSLLKSDKAYEVFVPSTWKGIKVPPSTWIPNLVSPTPSVLALALFAQLYLNLLLPSFIE